MTDTDSKSKYEALATTGLPHAMSQCRGVRLVETINTEVSQRVITSSESAIWWLQGTLYYIQSVRNPSSMGITVVSAHSMATHCFQTCNHAMQLLQHIGNLKVADGQEIFPLPASHVMSQRLVEYSAMSKITQLPFDATMYQVLKTLCQIEGLQRPVRRSEKKVLNAAHKSLKLHKLEGPPSKVRVREPWEKSFVLIQAYIEQVEIHGDFALHQEMTAMVEYASRMLAAIEEYSAHGSKNFNVVVQSLKIRRAISVHLWNGNGGLLQQIQGISKTTCYSLHLGGISTFDAVVKNSDDIIEKAANRSAPFGSHLKKACAKILSSRLKISATIESAATSGSPGNLICTLERPITVDASIVADFSDNASAVTYSLVAYTDRPNGGIMLKENIASPATFKVAVPPCFGKITLKLVASIVGLDDTVTLEGNDKTAPSGLFAKTGGGLKSASVRIRQPTLPNRETVRCQVTPRGPLVEVPCFQQKQAASVVLELKCKGERQRLRQSRLQHAFSNQASVTPSPKPPPSCDTAATGRNPSVHCSNTEKYPSVRQLSRNGLNKPMTSVSAHRNGSSSMRHESALDCAVPQDGVAAQAPQQDCLRQPAQRSRLGRNTFTGMHPSGGTVSHQSRNAGTYERSLPSTGWQSSLVPKRTVEQSHDGCRSSTDISSSWKRVKQHHQKHQQRAFVHKALNPFSQFQHDPNYTDKYLESLFAQSRSPENSIIPDSALAQNHHASQYHALRMQSQRPSHFCGRQPSQSGFPERCMSTQELLAQKADEHNRHAATSMSHGSLPWGASSRSQSWCPEEMRQPWGALPPSHQHDFPHQQDHSGYWNRQGTSETYSDLHGRGDEENRNGEFGQRDLAGPADRGFDYCHGSMWGHSGSTYGVQPVTSGAWPRGLNRESDEPPRAWDSPVHGTDSTGNYRGESAYFY